MLSITNLQYGIGVRPTYFWNSNRPGCRASPVYHSYVLFEA